MGSSTSKIRFSITYHPQTQEVVECMNSVVIQGLHCTLHEMNEAADWIDTLTTAKLILIQYLITALGTHLSFYIMGIIQQCLQI